MSNLTIINIILSFDKVYKHKSWIFPTENVKDILKYDGHNIKHDEVPKELVPFINGEYDDRQLNQFRTFFLVCIDQVISISYHSK